MRDLVGFAGGKGWLFIERVFCRKRQGDFSALDELHRGAGFENGARLCGDETERSLGMSPSFLIFVYVLSVVVSALHFLLPVLFNDFVQISLHNKMFLKGY